MTPTEADMNLAESLWSREATRARGCTCASVDIGVGEMHEPGCGDPRPEDVAVLITRAREEGRREERAKVVAFARLELPRRGSGLHVDLDDHARRVMDSFANAIEHNEHAAERGEEKP